MTWESVPVGAFPFTGEKILVVEDNPITADALAQFLIARGFAVEVANNASTALKVIEAKDPDVVLLDLGLPKMEDGLAVARQVRSRIGARQPLLVAITGFGGRVDENLSVEAGIDLHIVKPVEPLQLLDFLERFHQVAGR